MSETKKLYRGSNRILVGVCSGIAEYFNLDPNIVRIAWIIFCAMGGSGVLAYIIAAILIPEKPSDIVEY